MSLQLYIHIDFENPLSKLQYFPTHLTHRGCQKKRLLFKDIQQNHILDIFLAKRFFSLCVRGGLFSWLSMWVIRVVNLFCGIKGPSRHQRRGSMCQKDVFSC